MAKLKAHGRVPLVQLFVVLCFVTSTLPRGITGRDLSAYLVEEQNGVTKRVLKGAVNPPSVPSPGTYLDEPPGPAMPSSRFDVKFWRIPLPPPFFSPDIATKQIQREGSPKRILKGPVNPPSGPNRGTHADEPPLPTLPPSPPLLPSPDLVTKKQQIEEELRPKRLLKRVVNPPSVPSPGTYLDEPPGPAMPSSRFDVKFRRIPLPPPFFVPVEHFQKTDLT